MKNEKHPRVQAQQSLLDFREQATRHGRDQVLQAFDRWTEAERAVFVERALSIRDAFEAKRKERIAELKRTQNVEKLYGKLWPRIVGANPDDAEKRFSVYWTEVKYVPPREARDVALAGARGPRPTVYSEHIKGLKGAWYPPAALRRRATDWEWPLVLEAEIAFAALRYEWRAITTGVKSISTVFQNLGRATAQHERGSESFRRQAQEEEAYNAERRTERLRKKKRNATVRAHA